MPGSPDHPGLLRVAMLALALYSNVVFIIMPYMLRVRTVAITTRIFLLAALVIDAATGLLVPAFARLPAYWIWVAAIAAMFVAFVVFSGDPAPVAPGRSKDKAPVDRGEFSPFVWVLLGATLFWVAVSAINHAFPEKDGGAAGEPLTTYVNDRARLLGLDEASRLSFALQAFERVTPDQIVVAIYPRVPAGSIDEFTIGTAERSHLGHGGLDTGAILFVFMSERAARLEVGYGLEGALTDADAHRILETHLAPAFAQGAWFDGIDATLNAVFAKVRDAIKAEGTPDTATIWKRKLEDDRPNRLGRLWHSILKCERRRARRHRAPRHVRRPGLVGHGPAMGSLCGQPPERHRQSARQASFPRRHDRGRWQCTGGFRPADLLDAGPPGPCGGRAHHRGRRFLWRRGSADPLVTRAAAHIRRGTLATSP